MQPRPGAVCLESPLSYKRITFPLEADLTFFTADVVVTVVGVNFLRFGPTKTPPVAQEI